MVLRVPLQTAGAQRVMNVVVKLLHPCRAVPGPGGWLLPSHQHPFPLSSGLQHRQADPAGVCALLLLPASGGKTLSSVPARGRQEGIWQQLPASAAGALCQATGAAGMELCQAQTRAGCCPPGASLVPCPADTSGQRARAGSTMLTTIASLRNLSYSCQYLFAQKNGQILPIPHSPIVPTTA